MDIKINWIKIDNITYQLKPICQQNREKTSCCNKDTDNIEYKQEDDKE